MTKDNPPELQIISRQQLAKAAGQDGEIYAVYVEPDRTANHSLSDHSLPLRRLLSNFQDVFPEDLPDRLPSKRIVNHKIKLEPGAQPPYGPIYGLSSSERDELKCQMTELIRKGFI